MRLKLHKAKGSRLRTNLENRAKETESSQDPEFVKCSSEPAYFIDSYGVINDTQENGGSNGTMPFKLWDAQKKAVQEIHENKEIIILKARQLGISWLVCAYVLWFCLFHPGKLVLLFSITKEDAQDLISRITALYTRLPDWLRAACPVDRNPLKSSIHFLNGSIIKSYSSKPTAGSGQTASIVVMDEAAKMQFGNKLYDSIKATAADGTKTKFIILSTAWGMGNIFHKIWEAAEAKINDFHTIFIPYWERPGRDEAWYQERLRNSSDRETVKQDYPRNPLEAFLVSGLTRFHAEWIALQSPNVCKPLDITLFQNHPQYELLRSIDRVDIYQMPILGRRVGIGADPAEGLEKRDFSCATVVDLDSLEELACICGHWEPDEFAEMIYKLSVAYRAWIVVERNNHGHTVLSKLRSLGADKAIATGIDDREGWLTDRNTKPRSIDEIAVGLRDALLKIHSQATLNEMRNYRRLANGKTGTLPGDVNAHDDRVMSWAVLLGWLVHIDPVAQARARHNPTLYKKWGA